MSEAIASPAEDQPTPAPVAVVEPVPAIEPAVAAEPAAAEPIAAKRPGRKPKAAPAAAVTPAPVAAPVAKPAPRKAAPVKTKTAKVEAKPTVATTPAKPKRVAAVRAKPAPKTKTKTPPSPKAAKVSALPKTKDKIMANTPIDFTAAFKTAFSDFQEKAKAAYEKSTAAFGEANDFAKGNVEAIVESGKILASGLQELGTALTTESRTAFETLTAEAKELAAVKSPTEFMQLQSTLLRKHFDAAVAQASKNTEAVLKLANEAVSPISNRVTLAVEKVSKAA